ncbi:hypothetical protein IC575_014997 [Cucumis melo]
MRIDGEPWKQPLSVEDDKVSIEISHFGRPTYLAELKVCMTCLQLTVIAAKIMLTRTMNLQKNTRQYRSLVQLLPLSILMWLTQFIINRF